MVDLNSVVTHSYELQPEVAARKTVIFELDALIFKRFQQLFKISSLRFTAQKMKFLIKDIFSKCDQILRKLRTWTHFLKESLMVNFIFLCSKYLII